MKKHRERLIRRASQAARPAYPLPLVDASMRGHLPSSTCYTLPSLDPGSTVLHIAVEAAVTQGRVQGLGHAACTAIG